MLLNDIVENSNYVTDEELTDNNLVGMANTAIAEVNSKCKTNLPLFTEDNVSGINYIALKGTWCLRLIEPYYSYSIAANDTDTNARDFHYNRFLQALNEFKDSIDDAVLKEIIDPETGIGTPTGFEGNAVDMAKIDASEVSFHWLGLW